MKGILDLFVKVIIALALIFLTTFGWKPSSRYEAMLSNDEQISSENMKGMVKYLSEDLGVRNYQNYKNLEKSASFIIKSFEELGYSVEVMPYETNDQTFKNIIAEKPNGNVSDDTLLIGAHYDSCFNPGADDNASGVAGLIELARLLKDTPFRHRLKFAAFVNEEPPFFQTDQMGSLVYIQKTKLLGKNIKTAIILEMLGYYSEKPFSQKYPLLLGPFYPNKANFIAIVGNFPSKGIVKSLTKGFRQNSKFPVVGLVSPGFIPGVNFSDHWSFWQVGIPAVMVTDTAYLRSQHYHQNTDLPDTLDYQKMAKVVFGLKEAIVKLDKELSD